MIQAKRPSLSTLFKGIALCAAIAMGVAVEKIYPTYKDGDREGCTFVPDTKAGQNTEMLQTGAGRLL